MRIWSIHPSLLDSRGLVALWREGLLAQKVLQGETKGYKFHPQLYRFKASDTPMQAIATYLHHVLDEARTRGFNFDASKIVEGRGDVSILVTRDQLEFEFVHLKKKLAVRDPKWLEQVKDRRVEAHPIFEVRLGPVETWEVQEATGSGAAR